MEAGADVEGLPAEVWALVCERLDTADLVHMSYVSWTLRGHVLSRLRHHAPFPSGIGTTRTMMKHMLAFLSTLPRLVSLDLSAWDNFSSSLVANLPVTLQKLSLSGTYIADQGLAHLPVGVVELDLSDTHITSKAFRHLSRLTELRELNVSNIGQMLPASLEVLDISHCKKGNLADQLRAHSTPPTKGLSHIPWPASLRRLHIRGYQGLAMGLLYEFPPQLEVLDISECALDAHPVDFDVCLPRLRTLIASGTRPHHYGVTSWSLPSGLEQLHLGECMLAWDLMAFLPGSITHLDLSYTSLADDQYISAGTAWSDPFINAIHLRLPKLKYLALDHAGLYYYQWRDRPRCVSFIPASVKVVARSTWSSGVSTNLAYRPQSSVSPELVREQDAKWHTLVARCATQRTVLEFAPISPPPEVGDDEEPLEDNDEDEGGLLYGL